MIEYVGGYRTFYEKVKRLLSPAYRELKDREQDEIIRFLCHNPDVPVRFKD